LSRTVTIHFKDNQPHRVTGAGSPAEATSAMAFGAAFVAAAKGDAAPPLDPKDRVRMRHALGLDLAKVAYRNRYAAVPGTPQAAAFDDLAARGFAERGSDKGGIAHFSLTDAGIEAVTEPGEREQCRWVYRSKRGLVGIVHAAFTPDAWKKANKRHAVEVLWSDEGEAWVIATNGAPVREKGLDKGESEMTDMRQSVADAQRGGQ
jgi:hypothetical protein